MDTSECWCSIFFFCEASSVQRSRTSQLKTVAGVLDLGEEPGGGPGNVWLMSPLIKSHDTSGSSGPFPINPLIHHFEFLFSINFSIVFFMGLEIQSGGLTLKTKPKFFSDHQDWPATMEALGAGEHVLSTVVPKSKVEPQLGTKQLEPPGNRNPPKLQLKSCRWFLEEFFLFLYSSANCRTNPWFLASFWDAPELGTCQERCASSTWPLPIPCGPSAKCWRPLSRFFESRNKWPSQISVDHPKRMFTMICLINYPKKDWSIFTNVYHFQKNGDKVVHKVF